MRFDDVLLSPAGVTSVRERAAATVDAVSQGESAGCGHRPGAVARDARSCAKKFFAACSTRSSAIKSFRLAAKSCRPPAKAWCCATKKPKSKAQIEQAFAKAGLKVPLLKDVLASLPVDKVRAQKIVTLLLRDRVLVKLADELVFHRDALAAAAAADRGAESRRRPKLNVGNFKDLFGITRKHAIPLLEYLDRERVTRRVGDERVIL